MTTVAGTGIAPRTLASPELAGTGSLLRLALRRDRIMMPIWVLALSAAVVNTAGAFTTLYDSAAERAGLAQSMNLNSSLRALYGPVFDDSLGALTAWRMVGFGGVLAAIMSLVIVVRHTREEEETGRQELLSSAVVGHRAPLTAALLAALVANGLLGLVITAGLTGLGLAGGGALALGLAVAGQGVFFAAVAAVTAQLTVGARAAKGMAGAALGLAFLLRAAGDAADDDASSPLVWVSPVGWAENVRAFAGDRWWVLALLYAGAAATAAAAYVLSGRRDVGSAFLAARPGAPGAPRHLSGPYGLAWRLHRGSLLGWSAGFAVGGLVFGAITDGVADLARDNEQMKEIFERMGGAQGLTDTFLASMIGVLGMIAALYAVSSVMRMRSEETGERAEPVLAGSVGRLRWAVSHLVFAFLGTAVVMVTGGLAMTVGYGLTVGGAGEQAGRMLGASLAQLPAAWVLASVAVLLFGAVPKASVAAWAAAGTFLAIGWLGPTLKFPQAVMDLSPFSHLPRLPGGEVTAAPFVWMPALAVVLTAAGLAAFRRRDLG